MFHRCRKKAMQRKWRIRPMSRKMPSWVLCLLVTGTRNYNQDTTFLNTTHTHLAQREASLQKKIGGKDSWCALLALVVWDWGVRYDKICTNMKHNPHEEYNLTCNPLFIQPLPRKRLGVYMRRRILFRVTWATQLLTPVLAENPNPPCLSWFFSAS